jgi:hypothetical protein
MPRLGLLVLLAGIGVALFLYLPAPGSSLDSPPPFATVQDAASTPDAPPMVRGTSGHDETAQNNPSASASTSPLVTSEKPTSWQTQVSVEEPTTTPELPKTLSPKDPDVRYGLVLDIQRQLKRVGCYEGHIDGSWGSVTKNAMREFTNRVNATLPLDTPDYAQLALVQSHAGNACGACPTGQSLSTSGRCVAPPITAQAKGSNAPEATAQQEEVLPWKGTSETASESGQPLPAPTPSPSTEPLPERMAVGGPDPKSVDVDQSAPRATPGIAAAPTSADPNVPPTNPSATVSSAQGRSSAHHRRRFAGNDTPRQGRGAGLSLPRRNLLMSLGGLY